jgi:hypothetical protein
MTILDNLCLITAFFAGRWLLDNGTVLNQNNWLACPKTLDFVNAYSDIWNPKVTLANHPGSYSCYNKTIHRAILSPLDNCHLLNISSSMRLLSRRRSKRKRIMFIGDSLIAQTFITAKCYQEIFSLYELQLELITDPFLRNDLPCQSDCFWNATFRDIHRPLWNNPCFACPDGILYNFTEFLKSPKAWMNRIPSDTFAIILGSGPWYNDWKGIQNSNQVFQQTLQMITPIIKDWINTRKLLVIWQGLPPMRSAASFGNSQFRYWFDWDGFPTKDHLAQRLLEPLGVYFFNVSGLLKVRKFRDRNISADDLHWCNPGLDTVPTFLYQLLLHIMVTSTIKK